MIPSGRSAAQPLEDQGKEPQVAVPARTSSRTPPTEFQDRVWFYNPRRKQGRLHKLQRSWEGPCVVVKVLKDVLFQIRTVAGRLRVVHHDRLPSFCEEGVVLGSSR